MAQTIEKALVSTTRESANGPMVGIVDGAVVALHIGHQVVVQVEAEHVTPETRTRCSEHTRWLCGQELIGIAVRQHDNHQ